MENEKTAQTNLEAGAENVQDLGAKDSTASQTVKAKFREGQKEKSCRA